MKALDELAGRYGIAVEHFGMDGARHAVPDDTKRRILAMLGVDAASDEAIGAAMQRASGQPQLVMEAAPGERCFLPDWLRESRAWGIALQLYELRSRRNWGIGDFADLAEACRIAARVGADFVGINPLHALFGADPTRCSPFFPSNRLFLNPLYIAVDNVAGFLPTMVDAAALESVRSSDLVDYKAVSKLKLSCLRQIFLSRKTDLDPQSSDAFQRFREEQGQALASHALFEAISDDMAEAGKGVGWHGWPEPLRDVESPDVAEFALDNIDEVEFHTWLQWLAHSQLRETAEAGRKAGLRIGLYLDLAVGEAPDGSATWSHRQRYVPGMSIGAPPDFFTAGGQDWGLSPLSPAAGASAHRRMMRSAMSPAGALRIDHAMSLWQLFFVPGGGVPSEGAYVRYPIKDLLQAVARTSHAARTVVIGEDLGVVPEGFRDVMAQSDILSYRILYFEVHHGHFLAPERYPVLALACLSTHDLPTLDGWWRGDDVTLRLVHRLIEPDAAERQTAERETGRIALINALLAAGVLAQEQADILRNSAESPDSNARLALAVAAHRFMAKTPCLLTAARLADLTGERSPTNLPGTVDSYPNWRPKSSVPLEEWESTETFKAIASAMSGERPKRG